MTDTPCEHKRTILATAEYVDFRPDQEPFESGKIECAGVANINVPMILMHWCPDCKRVVGMEDAGANECTTETCTSANRCDGHC